MENREAPKEDLRAIIEPLLVKETKTACVTRTFHPLYGKPYFDDSRSRGKQVENSKTRVQRDKASDL
jgi:hypothetical protein